MNPTLPTTSPPTLRQIAGLVGVSVMTVSRALGNRTGISEETRERIAAVAARMGYRPDPELTKLMHHVRSRHRPRFQNVLCGLTTRSRESREPYTMAIVAGARRRAEELGHGFMVMHVAPDQKKWSEVQRTLLSRGVQGLLLLPQRVPIDLSHLLDWRAFSVVAATASVTAPTFNRVTPDQFGNALLLCRTLAARGYRRLGFVTTAEHDRRVNHAFDAAVIWHGLRESGKVLPPLVLPANDAGALEAWFRRERPDAIIASHSDQLAWVRRTLKLKCPGRVGMACTTTAGTFLRGISGIDERPGEIGAAAVDQLAGLVTRRVCGIPSAPASTSVVGIWKDGGSCRGLTAKAGQSAGNAGRRRLRFGAKG